MAKQWADNSSQFMNRGRNFDRLVTNEAAEPSALLTERARPFHTTRINWISMPDECCDWHRHADFEIWWIKDGSGEYQSDLGNYPLGEGTSIFVSIGQLHQWEFSPDLAGQRIGFSAADINNHSERHGFLPELPFFFGPNRVPVLLVPAASRSFFNRDFETLRSELESSDPHGGEAARAILRLLLIRTQRLFEKTTSTRIDESASAKLARCFWWELEKNFLTRRRVQDYAPRLQVTVNQLVETVREQFSRTPGELIDERVYLEGKRLLAHTTRTVSEIAYLLQFKTPSHFGAFFKRQAGCSPGEARRRLTATGSNVPCELPAIQSMERDK